jgi:uncharacterized membrane protein
VVLTLACGSDASPSSTIQGRVRDSSGEPVSATVIVVGNDLQRVSADGTAFEIAVTPGTYDVIVYDEVY